MTGSWLNVRSKGNFRLKGIRSTNPVAVGDRVQIILNQEGTAFISEIEDRKNYIIRRSSNLSKQSHILAANLDQCMLVVTVNYPETSTTFIDRFLASAEAYRVPVKILFNKVDAYDEDELHYLDSLITLYTQIGYPCFKISALTGEGVDAIREELKGQGNPSSPDIREWVNQPSSMPLFRGWKSRLRKYQLITTRECTPPLSPKCSLYRETDTLSTLRESKVLVLSIWKRKR